MNATNKFPTSADGRNPYEFNAARHCRRGILHAPRYRCIPTRVYQPYGAAVHMCARICAYVHTGACACFRAPARAQIHTASRRARARASTSIHTHARTHARTHTMPTIARAHRQFTSYTHAVIARINNLITYMRPR
jgi:hypothetical protein